MKHQAYLDGWFVHKNNHPKTNPYHEQSQPYSNTQWLNGWCARYDAIKHGLDLSLDEEEFMS